MKVTDRRLFTPDGELREEYRHLEESAEKRAAESSASATAPAAKPETPSARPEPATPLAEQGQTREVSPAPKVEGYPEPDPGRPTFLDLVALLAEPASLYLREANMGDAGELRAANQKEQHVELARLHIDLLALLRQKAGGQLDSRELAILDDALVQLQRGFVRVKG